MSVPSSVVIEVANFPTVAAMVHPGFGLSLTEANGVAFGNEMATFAVEALSCRDPAGGAGQRRRTFYPDTDRRLRGENHGRVRG